MNSTSWAPGPLAAAQKMFPMTLLTLLLVVIFAIAALLIIVWGVKLARGRAHTRHVLEERGELAPPHLHAREAAVPPPAPEASTGPADDLTRMKGVGPKLAEQLNVAGITRFAQIATLSPDEAAALDARLGSFQGRLARDRWIEQAKYLAAGDTEGFEKAFGRL